MSRVVEARGLSKRFLLRRNRSASLKERFLGLLDSSRREKVEEFWALRDVSLAIDAGEAVAIVGRNGSGKSTFLRLVAGIHRPTSGLLAVKRGSRVGTMIELGIGFHPELSGRENVFLNAAVHGLSRVEIEALYDRIVEYSGLSAFMDVALKNYSSGMHMRLGFSVAANLAPDFLLLDEVFAVGDEAFQQQCMRTMQGFRAKGCTILFVSHSPAAIKTVCERVCVLDQGRLLYDGPVELGLDEYHRVLAQTNPASPEAAVASATDGSWHRLVPGGHWAEAGKWAFDLLREEGLRPDQFVLDVGCGSLATGRHLLAFLEEHHYWGIEPERARIEAGVRFELPQAGLSRERGTFVVNDTFDLSPISQHFDFAIAEGLFARLPLNRIARCIASVVRGLSPGGRFFATWYESPLAERFDPIDRGSFTTYCDAEPYHYSFPVLSGISEAVGARAERVNTGRSHPRGESVMLMTRSG
jgi:ABC-type polysaccharide/polyol phosphate transport system ATPase subunit